jgi:hypothetical protein
MSRGPLSLQPLGVKWLKHEDDHASPSSAKVKNACSFSYMSPVHLHGMVLRPRGHVALSSSHHHRDMVAQSGL